MAREKRTAAGQTPPLTLGRIMKTAGHVLFMIGLLWLMYGAFSVGPIARGVAFQRIQALPENRQFQRHEVAEEIRETAFHMYDRHPNALFPTCVLVLGYVLINIPKPEKK